MAFLVPAVLAGAAAIAAPIAIHLLNKRQVKVIPWAATRFLLESVKKNQQRLKIEDLILLLLRCLFIVLLALAFARFVLNPGGVQGAGNSGPAVAVIILDQSASMGQSDGFQTRFVRAKDAADKLLGQMGSGSQVALFLAGSHVRQMIPRPTSNLPLVRRTLEVAEPTLETSDLAEAIRLALETLKPFEGARKEIFVLSDNQASAWTQIAETEKLVSENSDVQITFVNLGAEAGEDNLAITSLIPETRAPAADQATGFLIEVSNFGAVPAEGVRVTLSVDDGPPVDEAVIDVIGLGESRTLRLNARFPSPGSYTLRAAIPADRMPSDNERAVAVRVIDRITMAIVEGGSTDAKNDSRDAFFLANALTPVPPARRADYYLQVEAVAPSWLQTADLSNQAAIFLSNVPKLGPAAAEKLEEYVRGGGALVIFPGSRVEPNAYNADPVLSTMLPAILGNPIKPGQDDQSLTWQTGDYPHPITSLWNDKKNGNLGSVRATGYFPLELPPTKEPATDTRVIVNYTDGSPAAVEAPYGKGRVVLFSGPATTDWSNLPIHPNFVPFLRRLIGHLASEDSATALAPGSVFLTKVPIDLAGREVSVIAPGSDGKPRTSGLIELGNQEAILRFRDTNETGAYRFFVPGSDQPIAALAVQMEAKESDLKMLPNEQFATLSTRESSSGALENAPPAKVRREFWTIFLWAGFLVAMAEMALAHRFSFAK